MAEAFKFELVSPSRLLMSEAAHQVVVPGVEGYFTMLKGHSPFMTTIRPGILEMTAANGNVSKFLIIGGFADASPDGLTVLADQAIPVSELKPEIWAKEIADAEAALAAAKTDDAKFSAGEKLAQIREVASELGA